MCTGRQGLQDEKDLVNQRSDDLPERSNELPVRVNVSISGVSKPHGLCELFRKGHHSQCCGFITLSSMMVIDKSFDINMIC